MSDKVYEERCNRLQTSLNAALARNRFLNKLLLKSYRPAKGVDGVVQWDVFAIDRALAELDCNGNEFDVLEILRRIGVKNELTLEPGETSIFDSLEMTHDN